MQDSRNPELLHKCELLKKFSASLGVADTKMKNEALLLSAQAIDERREEILRANQIDVENARKEGMKESLVDRLALSHARIDDIIEGIKTVAGLKDPVWKSSQVWTLENGLVISKMTCPMGVIGIIYESRPNVTADAFALALKSGNGVLLRGSSSAIHSNTAIVSAIKEGLGKSRISPEVLQLLEDVSRETVEQMLKMNGYIDLIIPRGGRGLIRTVVENATVPTIETGVGNCHIFIDESGKLQEAVRIVENAKLQKPGACNACETVLVHEKAAKAFLPMLYEALKDKAELRGCPRTRAIIDVKPATEEDWQEEYLDYILAVKVVDDLEEAIGHIGVYGTKHSECIVTENYTHANRFLREVDAACVYVNASTRFTDGGMFGFGCEMGISTQKMHARGPMGLSELVTVKYTIQGEGQIR